jgi:hypothetical protein
VNWRRVLFVKDDLLWRHWTVVGQWTEIIEDGGKADSDGCSFVAWQMIDGRTREVGPAGRTGGLKMRRSVRGALHAELQMR